jgi:glutamate carboxypeptidase
MVSSRRGLGQFHIAVEGVAAHAGSAHERGRSAIRELAHKILAIEALTDYARGVTLNVGTVQGGSKRNIVPERAEAWIDLRYDEPAQGAEVRAALERIAAQSAVPGTRTVLWGTLHRPPKLLTPGVQGLLERQAEAARALGFASSRALHSGGGTDGSLMGAVGLAALDSIGAVGGNAHTDREWVSLASLPERSALAALLLRRLIRRPLYAAGGEG